LVPWSTTGTARGTVSGATAMATGSGVLVFVGPLWSRPAADVLPGFARCQGMARGGWSSRWPAGVAGSAPVPGFRGGKRLARLRAPLSRRRPLHVVEVPPMSSVSWYSARLLARLRSCRPSGRVTRPAHRRAGRFPRASRASAPPSSLLPDRPWQPSRHLPFDESSGRTCRAPLRRAGSGSV
jgi:hypothetical protein